MPAKTPDTVVEQVLYLRWLGFHYSRITEETGLAQGTVASLCESKATAGQASFNARPVSADKVRAARSRLEYEIDALRRVTNQDLAKKRIDRAGRILAEALAEWEELKETGAVSSE